MRIEPVKNTPDFIGYAHPAYALSFQEFGEPRELPGCGGWIIVRPIPGTLYKDAIGCYPLFACRDWTKLHEDLEHVSSDLVSLVLVADPFPKVGPAYLKQCFDVIKPFKTHYVADLSHPLENFVDRGHRYSARKSLKIMTVEVCSQPAQYLDDWIRLYDNLIRKHDIRGINAFSHECFKIQLNVPGMVMVLGRLEGEIIGASLFLLSDQVAYTHLSAYSSEAYKIRASYGIRWKALVYLYDQGIRYVDLGGMAGTKEDPSDDLAQFKRGWSNGQRVVYFCGRVFDRHRYESICRQYMITNADYFPAYRSGEVSTGMSGEHQVTNRDISAF
jgi:hypothetical protein